MAREIDLKVKEYVTKTSGTPTTGVGPPRKSDKRVYSVAYKNGNVKFECDSRYTPIESIGTGAYGVVCAAKDNRTGRKVAIKKITKAFDIITVAKRTYRELKILRHLRHDNVISILDVMEPPDESDQFNDVYVVLDLMESDLHHIIHSVQPLSDEHVKFFLYQICRGLKYIHSARLLHRDLKPSNLLINRNCELKIGDFGMARGMFSASDDHSSFMTEYVATRWYRAPELMLSLNEYTEAIDMWSVGCIFAEMLGRRQLFPGKNYLNQLQLILSVVGTPDDKYIQKIGSDKVKSYLKTLPSRSPIGLNVLFPNADKESLVLLQKMLYLDPSNRCSAVEVLSHSYLSRYHDPADEPICTPPFDFSFEKKLLTKEALKEAFKEEILEYHKCRMPIPPNDEVKSALKKMMEEREKGVEVESKESKRKRLEEKKRKFPEGGGGSTAGGVGNQVGPDKQKKRPRGSNSPLSDADKSVLEHWNKIQQTLLTRAKERLGNKADNANMEEFFQHQELLIKQQSEQLDRQQSQMMEQQRRIQQQAEQIRVLVHQQKVLIRECKASGMKIPLSTPNPSPLTPPFPSLSPNLSKTQPSTVNNVSRPIPAPSDTTNSSSKLVAKPSSPNIIVSSPLPVPATHPPPPSSVPQTITKPSISISSVVSSSRSIPPIIPTPPKVIPPRTTTIVTVTPPSILHDSIVTQAPPYPAVPAPPMFPHQPHPSLPHPLPVYPNSGQFHQRIPPQVSMATTDYMMSQYVGQLPPPHPQQQDPMIPFMNHSHLPPFTGPDFSSVFSPLTSKELMELTSQEIHNLSPCDPHSVGSFNPPFDELDNLFNLPTGCGAGYGVGVSEDDLQVSIPPNNEVSGEGPQSANILEDWLVDMDRMDPQGMEALQQEMEFGASDMFFRDLDKL